MRKKIRYSLFAFMAMFSARAQMVSDTVTTGPGYANHSWYSLETGNTVSVAKNTWDIAFATSAIGMGSSIRINSVIGTQLWLYPGDTSDWSTLDTAGMTSWTSFNNSDTSWLQGAFDAGVDPSDEFDLGWGVYNFMSHVVTGDSLFVIKLSDNSYRKIWIQNLASGTYNFKFANLDNTGATSQSIVKSSYSGKNFAYYSLRTDTETNPEPMNTDWDFLFTQYTTNFPGVGQYPVTGVLQNHTTKAVKVHPVDDPMTYDDFSAHSFSTEYNIVGYNWKAFTGGVYVIEDSLVYLVQTQDGDIWRVVFTGFGGSTNGDFYFKKEKISSVGISNIEAKPFMSVYPNPCSNGTATLVVDATEANSRLDIYSTSGQLVYNTNITSNGLTQITIPVSNLQKGTYLVRFVTGTGVNTSKLIIN